MRSARVLRVDFGDHRAKPIGTIEQLAGDRDIEFSLQPCENPLHAGCSERVWPVLLKRQSIEIECVIETGLDDAPRRERKITALHQRHGARRATIREHRGREIIEGQIRSDLGTDIARSLYGDPGRQHTDDHDEGSEGEVRDEALSAARAHVRVCDR